MLTKFRALLAFFTTPKKVETFGFFRKKRFFEKKQIVPCKSLQKTQKHCTIKKRREILCRITEVSIF